jgi:tRNA (guanine37-N1)-methyltransferase
MRFDVVTLFPDMVRELSGRGVTGRALARGAVQLNMWNPRDFTRDRHRTVDDRPYGGGPGMVMKYEPLAAAVEAAKASAPAQARVLYLSPQGRRLDQAAVNGMARRDGLILVAGRYEGIDERVIDRYVDEEWSIGDYVLSGGELAALVVIDAVTRLLPDVLGDPESAHQDSYMQGLLDCPHYTRPERIEGRSVPKVLRLQQALGRTHGRRPDLLARREMTPEEERLLDEFIRSE